MSEQHELLGTPDAVPPAPRSGRVGPRAPRRTEDPLNTAAYLISRLRPTLYQVYRLFSLYGPTHDEGLVDRAGEHDVPMTADLLLRCRAELVQLHYLRPAGRSATDRAGAPAIIWELEPDRSVTSAAVQAEDQRAAIEGGSRLTEPLIPERERAASAPTGWWNRELIVLDTETTGTDPRTARILQLALHVNLEGGLLTTPDDVVCLVRHDPPIEIPADAAAVHGITAERCTAEGRDLVHVLTEAIQTLEVWAERGHPLVIFNAGYDRQLFFAECARAGVQVPRIVAEMPVVDPLCLHKGIEPKYYGRRRLIDLLERYGGRPEDPDRLHDAAEDARVTALLLRLMGLRHPNIIHQSLDVLQAYQIAAYRAWRAGSLAYWAGKGQQRDIQPVEWLGP